MPVAVGTSLVVIALKSFTGLAGHLTPVPLGQPLVGGVALAAIVGSLAGARPAGRIPEAALHKGFGIFVLAMSVVVLTQELPGAAGADHPDVLFASVDIETQPGLASATGIRAPPTLMIFRDGQLVQTRRGGLRASSLARTLARARR